MGILEIISAVVLVIACVFIILVVLMQDTKHNMSQTISGGSADNYFQKNSGRSNEAKLNRLTKTAAIVFFAVALIVNFIVMYSGNFEQMTSSSSNTTSSSVTETSSKTESTTSDNKTSGETTSSETTSSETTSSETTSSETTSSETTSSTTSETKSEATSSKTE